MNTKKLITLLVLLLVVVGIVVLTENMDTLSSSADGGAFLPDYAEDNVSAFLIADAKDTVKIRRKGDIWVVAAPATDKAGGGLAAVSDTAAPAAPPATSPTYPADSASVATVLEKLDNLTTDDLISNNPAKQEVFEVDSANGVLVKIWDRNDELLGSFRIGKSGASWSTNYVRKIGSDKVYSVGGSIKSAFFSDTKRWRDKTIQKFDKQRAQSITLVKGGNGRTIELRKKPDSTGAATWTIVAPETHAADSNAVDRLLATLANLRTTGWEENTTPGDDTPGFTEPELIASVTLDNGDTKEVMVGAKKGEENTFRVKAAGKEPVFLVADHTISTLDVSMDELKAVAPADESEEDEAES
jgi:hypothetical protein